MADEKKSRGVEFVSCNENDYCCSGKCAKGEDVLPYDVQRDADDFWRKEEARESGKSNGELTVKLDVDVSDALTGLKAIQREAKEATKAARELEQAYKDAETAVNSDKIASIISLRDIQGQPGNWDVSEYMRGLYNGLELASATLEGRDPEYKTDTFEDLKKILPKCDDEIE